ncbi:MAG: protein SCO1/2 [Algoriphagus sp.]|jgi:protein SCO1/2
MKKYLASLAILLSASCAENAVEQSTESDTRVESLPYYQSADFTPVWFENPDSVPVDFHRIPDFSFTNQLGQTISQEDMEDQIFVVDFFFTTCPGICPKMTGNMKLVQNAFAEDTQVSLLSHSVTPGFDEVKVLAEYADRYEVIAGKWHLLTGEREKIYDLARNYYFVEEDMGLLKSPDEFLHTENFILIDQNKHLRGIYNGLNTNSINQLIADIKSLQNK